VNLKKASTILNSMRLSIEPLNSYTFYSFDFEMYYICD